MSKMSEQDVMRRCTAYVNGPVFEESYKYICILNMTGGMECSFDWNHSPLSPPINRDFHNLLSLLFGPESANKK